MPNLLRLFNRLDLKHVSWQVNLDWFRQMKTKSRCQKIETTIRYIPNIFITRWASSIEEDPFTLSPEEEGGEGEIVLLCAAVENNSLKKLNWKRGGKSNDCLRPRSTWQINANESVTETGVS